MEDRYLFKAKELDDGEWVQGYCVKGLDVFENCEEAHIIFEPNAMFYSSGETDGWYKVDSSTICQCTGLKDKDGNLIWENDIVDFLGHKGTVVFECGSFGIVFREIIDWEEITSYIMPITGCENALYACKNDNYISLWEIYWNFNDEDDSVNTVEVIGNIFDGGFNGKNSKKD